jgi:hypothetical protein
MVPDHVWDSFDQMARDMGADRDSLVAQAMFMFARLNGYLAPGTASIRSNPSGASAGLPARDPVARKALDPDGARRSAPPPKLGEPLNIDGPNPARREVADRVLETAAELERMIKDPPAELPAPEAPTREGSRELFLVGENGALDKVAKDRFVIGRGKHCDLVINSGKVSREHAAILREGSDHFIEDLGSSNGTWFDKQRIHRRKIENGDEYFICNEKVKCVLR